MPKKKPAKKPKLPPELLAGLLDAGYTPTALARALGVELDELRSLVPSSRIRLDPSEEELRRGIRVIALRALAQMGRVFDVGTEEARMRLATNLLSPMVRQAISSSEVPKELDELREEFDKLLGEMRHGIIESESAPPTAPTDDPH